LSSLQLRHIAERGMTADLMALWMLLVIVLAIAGAWRLK
jgi:hypothetical protein